MRAKVATPIPDSVQRAVQAVHETDPEDHERHLVDRVPELGAGVQAGDEIGDRDIDEAGGGHGKDIRQGGFELREPDPGAQGAGHRGEADGDVIGESPAAGIPAVQEDSEIADLLRDLMGRDRETRHDAEPPSDRKAAAMSTPSTKLWIASPTRIKVPMATRVSAPGVSEWSSPCSHPHSGK